MIVIGIASLCVLNSQTIHYFGMPVRSAAWLPVNNHDGSRLELRRESRFLFGGPFAVLTTLALAQFASAGFNRAANKPHQLRHLRTRYAQCLSNKQWVFICDHGAE